MPTYVVRARAGLLGPTRRRGLAERITDAHARVTGTPRSFAQVLVEDLRGRDHFIGGRPAEAGSVFVHGHIRAGRDAATTAALADAVREATVAGTGVSADLVWVYLSELAPERMVEFGRPLPPPGGEREWVAALPEGLRRRLARLDDPDGAAVSAPPERPSSEVLSRARAAALAVQEAPDPFEGLADEDAALPSVAFLEHAATEATQLRVDREAASTLLRVTDAVAAGELARAHADLGTVDPSSRLARHAEELGGVVRGPGTEA